MKSHLHSGITAWYIVNKNGGNGLALYIEVRTSIHVHPPWCHLGLPFPIMIKLLKSFNLGLILQWTSTVQYYTQIIY